MANPGAKRWHAALSSARAVLVRRGRSEQDADDLVQEAWVRMAVYQQEQVVLEPEAFLMRTAINLSIDAHRMKVNHGPHISLEEVDELELVDESPTAEATVLAKERVARLRACVNRLSEKPRDMLIAHRIEGLSYKDIAEQHKVHITTVEKHIAKAMLLVSDWMKGW